MATRDPSHEHKPDVAVTTTLRAPLMGRKQARYWRCGSCLGAIFDGEFWYERDISNG